jgi:hypothetical protein
MDGRGALLHATESGVDVIRAEFAPRTRWLAEAMDAVCDDDDLATLRRAAQIMARMVDHGGVAPREP